MSTTGYVIDRTSAPYVCLPVGLDKSNLVDITSLGDVWRKYLDRETGEVHDCGKYFLEAMRSP